jgi:SAM-dependent methyltransferase
VWRAARAALARRRAAAPRRRVAGESQGKAGLFLDLTGGVCGTWTADPFLASTRAGSLAWMRAPFLASMPGGSPASTVVEFASDFSLQTGAVCASEGHAAPEAVKGSMFSPRGLAFHELMALLGVGDLHPGGRQATTLLLAELTRHGSRRVLEVGAGIGLTTERMVRSGLEVTAIEPNPILHRLLKQRVSIRALETPFEAFDDRDGSYDAVLAEGVLYKLGPDSSAAKVRRLLRPGGILAFVDMLWTKSAKADVVAFLHDQTNQVFGIPMAPKEVVTWDEWKGVLRGLGFSEVVTRAVDPLALHAERHSRRARIALGLMRRPTLLPLFLDYRSYRRIPFAPPGWLESLTSVWQRSP